MDASRLYEMLRQVQEPSGYFFNPDRETVFALLSGLIRNRERYGHMSCPCRLASGDYGKDRDIVCPCEYREADVKEYGSCYCGLYVSGEWLEGTIAHATVPERRPPEKVL